MLSSGASGTSPSGIQRSTLNPLAAAVAVGGARSTGGPGNVAVIT